MYVCYSMTSKKCTPTKASQERWTLAIDNHMLQICQEDIRFCYNIRGKSYDKYDPCYAVPRR